MDSNWYVIQVMGRKEEKVAELCKRFISKEILIDCFIPKYKSKRKYSGKWHEEEAILFTNYVFLISDHIDALFQELKGIPEITKLLGNDGNEIYGLRKQEVNFLKKFSNDYMVEMSLGYIEGDKIKIVDGPLMDYEGLIRKIDRHKRIAYLDIELFDQITTVKVGLEIISKT